MPWQCNECGSDELTDSVSEADLECFRCSNCGSDEFHQVKEKSEPTVSTKSPRRVSR
jgi:predicted  nucleic acid-binding Zn-ribbon protein